MGEIVNGGITIAMDSDVHEDNDMKKPSGVSRQWDMSQERMFIENLLNQRFNFFLIIFSAVIAGAMNAKTLIQFRFVLVIGSVITTLIGITLERSQEKLDIIINELFKEASHPVTVVDKLSRRGGTKRRILGILIPRICCSLLTAIAIFSLFGKQFNVWMPK